VKQLREALAVMIEIAEEAEGYGEWLQQQITIARAALKGGAV
jgi:hypothetical protein